MLNIAATDAAAQKLNFKFWKKYTHFCRISIASINLTNIDQYSKAAFNYV